LDQEKYKEDAEEILICPLIDARNDQAFTSIYKPAYVLGLGHSRRCFYLPEKFSESESPIHFIYPDRISGYRAEDIRSICGDVNNVLNTSKGQKVLFMGSAVKLHEEYLKGYFEDKYYVLDAAKADAPKAASVGSLAYKEASEGRIGSWAETNVFYLRESQAERLYKSGS